MQPVFQKYFTLHDNAVDRYGRLKPSMILYLAQEVAGRHFDEISMSYDALAEKGMFWAIIRQRVQISRMPHVGETIRVETWPMPTTRVAYPRSVVAYDADNNEVFRCISLWVLMDLNTRGMILPGKSGISVVGTLRGNELAAPGSLAPKTRQNQACRRVCYTDLDRNGHMNNTRYLDWIDDLLPSMFHEGHTVKEFTVCYLSEAREGQMLDLHWDFLEDGTLQVDAYRNLDEKKEAYPLFSAVIERILEYGVTIEQESFLS